MSLITAVLKDEGKYPQLRQALYIFVRAITAFLGIFSNILLLIVDYPGALFFNLLIAIVTSCSFIGLVK